MTNITNIISDQSDLNDKYKDYAIAYLSYIDCSVNTVNILNGVKVANHCSTKQNDLTSKYNELNTIVGTENGHAPTVYTTNYTSHPEFDASYQQMTQLRSKLDLKLQELYNKQNSIPQLYSQQLDSTVYSGILWTVLATTLIYYVFIKL